MPVLSSSMCFSRVFFFVSFPGGHCARLIYLRARLASSSRCPVSSRVSGGGRIVVCLLDLSRWRSRLVSSPRRAGRGARRDGEIS